MNPGWEEFLKAQAESQGVNLENNQHDSLHSQKASADEPMLADLSGYGLIRVSGEDAETFLQNQLTNDIREVTETSHQISAWCSPKGRIIATFRIFRRKDDFYLCVAADLLEHVIKKLGMYVMMSKVSIEDASDSLVYFGFSGENAVSLLQNAVAAQSGLDSTLANQAGQGINHQSFSILCIDGSAPGAIPGTMPRFEIYAEAAEGKQLLQALSQTARIFPQCAWDYHNILAGIPVITKASSEKWIPQMVNYTAIGGVSFKKGCYPGQEVVARLNYLGKTRRRMYHLLVDTDKLPAINDAIASDNDKEAGKILNAVINPENKVEALAVLKIAEADKPLSLTAAQEAQITLLNLPYSLEE